MIPIDYYRVHWNGPGGRFKPARWWRRTWQAEWPGCRRAPRAFTRRGVERKAIRWVTRECY